MPYQTVPVPSFGKGLDVRSVADNGTSQKRPRTACDGRGHDPRSYPLSADESTVPYGYCHCGCGEKTRLSTKTRRGYKAGEPLRFIHGHHQRPSATPYAVDPETGCWLWQWRVGRGGYAYCQRDDGKVGLAHRYYYERERGEIPEGLTLDHLCRTRRCVNPAHMEAVSHAENCRRAPRNKLTMEKAREIRALYPGLNQYELADRFGVAQTTIGRVLRNVMWAEDA